MKKIYITDYIDCPDVESDVLGGALSKSADKNIEILLVWHKHITKEFIDKFPNLRGIVRYGVGYDNIDLDYARNKNIYVCNTPDYGTEEVSDTAIAMIMNIARGICRYDYMCRNYIDKTWQENIILNIKRNSDYKLGVIGAGRIGSSLLLKAKSLRFQTGFYDPYVPRGHEKVLDARRYDRLDDMLGECDIISINCPLNKETKGMVNEGFLLKMRDGASLVNTARGCIIDDVDIFYEPLRSGKLSNVALDVIPYEPPMDSKIINAWKNKEEWLDGRFILNPHVAYYSDKAYFEMRYKAALNAKRILNNERPFNIVNGL